MGLTSYRRVLLDTTACVYYLEGRPGDRRRRSMEPLMRAAERGGTEILVSTLTVTELLVGPIRSGDRLAEAHARLFLSDLCTIVPVETAVAEAAARLRAEYRLPTPDALICATGIIGNVDAVVGNDARWKRVSEINYVHLDDEKR